MSIVYQVCARTVSPLGATDLPLPVSCEALGEGTTGMAVQPSPADILS